MSSFKYVEPTCSLCSGHKDMLRGSRFCEGGKKPRRFKPSDPKYKAPEWCPKRNVPPIVRVYDFKDDDAKYLDLVFNESANPQLVSEHHYMVVFETRGFANAKDFYERANSEPISELIDFEIRSRNIVEIDDGFRPYYFYCEGYMQFTNIFFRSSMKAGVTSEKSGKQAKNSRRDNKNV